MGAEHTPVLCNEVAAFMNCVKGGTYVDATIGNAGHALQLLSLHPGIRMLAGIDSDGDAVERARERLRPYAHKTVVLHGNFRHLRDLLAAAGIGTINGILFDLGASTPQLTEPSRGFSFREKGPLDMRMDQTQPLHAADLLSRLSARQLESVLRTYGEERWASRIAARIKRYQEHKPIESTIELADIVRRAIPARHHPHNIDPATRTFQALRIAVNDELQALEEGLNAAAAVLEPGGRICVISFHSLEDRIVKNRFKSWARGCSCPREIPSCVCGQKTTLHIVTRRPVTPSLTERQQNPRARSAKLRVGERLGTA